MKRFFMIVTVLMTTWLLQSVQAEGQRFSIKELNQMGQPEWQETYHANGRTVEVDCTVDIPDVSRFPVLTVQAMPPVEEPLYSALLHRYAAPKGTKLDYEFRSNDYQTVLTYADPGGWDEKAGEIPGKVTERWHSLLKYDLNGAYADNNDSFFEAGEICLISQSAISQQIRALEEELQVLLLERHGRKFTVTAAGRYFYEQAKRQTAALDALIREVRRIDKGEYQRLRVGVLNGFSSRIMQQAIREFSQNHPHVRLSLVTGTHEELFHPVNEGSLDMVINDQWRALSDQYINDELTEQPLFALVRQDHPCALAGEATLEELREELCILVCSAAQRETEAAHGRDVLGLQSNFLFADNLESARMNTAAGAGFYICDGDMAPPEGTALIPLMRGEQQLTRKMFAFWPEKSDSSLQWEFTAILHRIIK